MSNIIKLHELDCIFLSYDEPNADYNYADLLSKAPWAKRVHGVKGSDAAHKACADLSETEHFITVDADNIVDPKFFDLSFDLDNFGTGVESQLSWSGRNNINGLVYGNGGLKCWTRQHVWRMRTHEQAEDNTNQVDFCWDPYYHHVEGCFSIVYNNASALQAWRAGFREGVKMSLLSGIKLSNPKHGNFKKQLPKQNYQRLMVWMTVGEDVSYGLWAIYGARMGCYMTNCTDWDYTQVRDFDYLDSLFKEQELLIDNEPLLRQASVQLGEKLSTRLNLEFANFNKQQSSFYKETNVYLPRSNQVINKSLTFITDIQLPIYYDVVFISNGEPHADTVYQRLLNKCGDKIKIHRIDNVKGIFNAHKAAANIANTEMFFVVDADAWITDNFSFPTVNEINDTRYNYIYYSVNPLNHLCYGHGGLKVFPKHVFDQPLDEYVDMTTSVGQGIKILPVISNITKFNTDAFSTWRTAFRECAKLSSGIIAEQVHYDTKYRLDVWTSYASGDFANECIQGAIAGKTYGMENKNNLEAMQRINDYEFLEKLYKETNG
jgi:hypothetical protein